MPKVAHSKNAVQPFHWIFNVKNTKNTLWKITKFCAYFHYTVRTTNICIKLWLKYGNRGNNNTGCFILFFFSFSVYSQQAFYYIYNWLPGQVLHRKYKMIIVSFQIKFISSIKIMIVRRESGMFIYWLKYLDK